MGRCARRSPPSTTWGMCGAPLSRPRVANATARCCWSANKNRGPRTDGGRKGTIYRALTSSVSAVDQPVELTVGQVVERVHDDVGAQVRVGSAHTDRAHPGAARGLQPGGRVLDDDAAGRRNRQPLGADEENLRVGLAALHILGRHERIEERPDLERRDDRLDIRERRRRRDRLSPALRAQPRQPTPHAGQQVDPALSQLVAIARLFVAANARDLVVGQLWAEVAAQDRIVALAEGSLELLAGDVIALGVQTILPGQPVVLGRIEQRTVHIPEDGAGRIVCCHSFRLTAEHTEIAERISYSCSLRSPRSRRCDRRTSQGEYTALEVGARIAGGAVMLNRVVMWWHHYEGSSLAGGDQRRGTIYRALTMVCREITA